MNTLMRLSTRTIMVSFLTLALLIPTTPGFADEQADKIRALLEETIETRKKMVSNQMGMDLIWDGTLSVEPKDSYYAVRFPHASIQYPDGRKFDIGVMVMNVVLDTHDRLRGSIALPTPMVLYSADGKSELEVSIGSQRMAGVWAPGGDMFTTLDSEHKNIRLRSADGKVNFTIDSIKAVADLKENPDGTFTGPTDAVVKNITLQGKEDTGNQIALKIESLLSKNSITKLDLSKLREFEKNMADQIEAISQAGDDEDAAMHEMSNALFDYITHISDGFDTNLTLRGLSFDQKTPAGEPMALTLEKLSWGMAMNGLQGDTSDGQFQMGLSGLNSTALPKNYEPVIPRDMNINLRVANLPFQKLMATIEQATSQAMKATAESAEAQQQQAAMTMMALPQLLGEAGATLNIANTYVTTSLSKTKFEGQAVANPSAVLGGTGVFTMTMSGLDKLIAKFTELSQTEDGMRDSGIQQIMMGLTMMQMMGQQDMDKNGNPVRSYKLEVTADGQKLLNGTALDSMGGLAGGLQ